LESEKKGGTAGGSPSPGLRRKITDFEKVKFQVGKKSSNWNSMDRGGDSAALGFFEVLGNGRSELRG